MSYARTRGPGPRTSGHRRAVRLAAAAGLAAVLATVLAPGAGAARLVRSTSTITAKADSTGPIVVNSSGDGFVAWDELEHGSGGDAIEFCKIPPGGTCTHPVVLPIGKATHWDDYAILQPFTVVGRKAGVISVVGPSYVYSNAVIWTSTNGGKSFGAPVVVGSGFLGQTGVGDVRLAPGVSSHDYPDWFSIASYNPGLGYGFTGIGSVGARDPSEPFELDTASVPGAVDFSALGFDSDQTIEAFGTDAETPRIAYFWSPTAGVSGTPGSLEHGPTVVADGYDPRLAYGPKGTFLLTDDVGKKASDPLTLEVRKWDATTHRFNSPVVVGTVPAGVDDNNPGGFAEDSTNGELVVAWPRDNAKGGYEMDLWTSANGGKSFSGGSSIASIPGEYQGPAGVAATGSHGFVTWQDQSGLKLVDVAHL